MVYPNRSRSFWLQAYASAFSLGAVLSQKDKEGRKQIIAYFSRTLRFAEKKYKTSERELLAIVWIIKNYRHYLYGQKNKPANRPCSSEVVNLLLRSAHSIDSLGYA